MAEANLDTKKIKAGYQDMEAQELETTALNATDGGTFTVTAPSEKCLLIIENTDSSDAQAVTVKGPKNPAMGSGTGFPDRVINVPKSTTVAIKVETLRYIEADTKKIKITGSADVKVAVVEL